MMEKRIFFKGKYFTIFKIFSRSEGPARLLYSACHLAGMTSALTNPVIYGYFNQVGALGGGGGG